MKDLGISEYEQLTSCGLDSSMRGYLESHLVPELGLDGSIGVMVSSVEPVAQY